MTINYLATTNIPTLDRLRHAGACALKHLIKRTDSTDRVFAILDCQGCEDKGFCRKVARLIEHTLNR